MGAPHVCSLQAQTPRLFETRVRGILRPEVDCLIRIHHASLKVPISWRQMVNNMGKKGGGSSQVQKVVETNAEPMHAIQIPKTPPQK